MKAITRNLRVLRAAFGARGISQRDLAIKAGIQFWRYQDIERGYAQADEAEIGKIARALKCDAAEILGQSESVAS